LFNYPEEELMYILENKAMKIAGRILLDIIVLSLVITMTITAARAEEKQEKSEAALTPQEKIYKAECMKKRSEKNCTILIGLSRDRADIQKKAASTKE
jgi:hypothetical protein